MRPWRSGGALRCRTPRMNASTEDDSSCFETRIRRRRYFFGAGKSSTKIGHQPWGFALTMAFLMTVIFIVVSYAALATWCASAMVADS